MAFRDHTDYIKLIDSTGNLNHTHRIYNDVEFIEFSDSTVLDLASLNLTIGTSGWGTGTYNPTANTFHTLPTDSIVYASGAFVTSTEEMLAALPSSKSMPLRPEPDPTVETPLISMRFAFVPRIWTPVPTPAVRVI